MVIKGISLRYLLLWCIVLMVTVKARKMSKTKSKYQAMGKQYRAQPIEEHPSNIFDNGKGGKQKNMKGKGGKNKGKNKKSKSDKKSKSSKKANPIDFLRLDFEPDKIPVGVRTEIGVTLTSVYFQTTECVDFFNLYKVGVELKDVLVTKLVRARPSKGVFEGTVSVLSDFPGETFSFRAIPVIDGHLEPWSKLVTTALDAVCSAGPTMSPATVPSTPTRAPVTPAPTILRTPTPTRAPVTPAPTEPTTSIPTTIPVIAVPTETPSLNPTRIPSSSAPQTNLPTFAGEPVFAETLVLQGAPLALFGNSIALSSDGSILAVGAPFNNEFGSEAGRVGLYELVGTEANILFDFSGVQVGLRVGQSLSMSTTNPPILAIGGTDFVDVYPISQFLNGGGGPDPPILIFDRFEAEFINEDYGIAIAMSGDGTRLAVGAPRAFLDALDVGMVQVYNVDGTNAQIGTELMGVGASDLFGSAVSLSESGAIIAVGAITGESTAGYVKVFAEPNDVTNPELFWQQIGQTLVGNLAGDNFGKAVSISADGLTVAIGAIQRDPGVAAVRPGYVQVYQNVGALWTQIGEDIVGQNDGDQFGFSVALTADATFLTIGANAFDSDGLTDNGLVQVYENQNGTWVQLGRDIVGNADTRSLGTSVAISSSGQTITAGGPLSAAPVDTNIGEGYVYSLTA
jgi:hypothetical protein